MTRYAYAFGYKTWEAAHEALIECYATGEISDGDCPKIESYSLDCFNDTVMGRKPSKRRYCIKVNG